MYCMTSCTVWPHVLYDLMYYMTSIYRPDAARRRGDWHQMQASRACCGRQQRRHLPGESVSNLHFTSSRQNSKYFPARNSNISRHKLIKGTRQNKIALPWIKLLPSLPSDLTFKWKYINTKKFLGFNAEFKALFLFNKVSSILFANP